MPEADRDRGLHGPPPPRFAWLEQIYERNTAFLRERCEAYLYKYGFDLTGGTLVVVGVRQEEIVRRHAALMLFSLAIERVSRKVCIGVLP